MKENDWQLKRYFLLWLVLPFVVALSFYANFRISEEICKKYLLQFFRHYFICIATVKLLQFLRSFQINLFYTFYSNAFFKSIRES